MHMQVQGACAVLMLPIRASQGGQSCGAHDGGTRWRGWECGATRKTAPLDGQEGREGRLAQFGPTGARAPHASGENKRARS